jgi:phage-related minor tail protein
MADVDRLDGLQGFAAQTATLEESLSGARLMTAAFDAELARMREGLAFTGKEVSSLSSTIARSVGSAFDGVVFEGMKLSDAFKSVAQSISETAYRIAVRPVEDAIGGAVANGLNGLLGGLFPFEKGGTLLSGRIMPFARGGVVAGPVAFPMRGGTGLMGEAGPEAIMPLSRGADGRLGVRAAGGRAVNVTINVSTPDAGSFDRSRSQIAARMARVLSRGDRNG